MLAIALIPATIALGSETFTEQCVFCVLACTPGINLAVIKADRMMINHSNHAYSGEGNSEAAIPNMKAGPGLLEKASILLASFLRIVPNVYSCCAV